MRGVKKSDRMHVQTYVPFCLIVLAFLRWVGEPGPVIAEELRCPCPFDARRGKIGAPGAYGCCVVRHVWVWIIDDGGAAFYPRTPIIAFERLYARVLFQPVHLSSTVCIL